jgi:hypothetical protein
MLGYIQCYSAKVGFAHVASNEKKGESDETKNP